MKINYKLKYTKEQKPESSLFTAFTVDNVYLKFSPGKVIETKHWSESKQMVLSGHKHSTLINQHLKNYKNDIERIILEHQAKKIRLDNARIKEELNKIYHVSKTKPKEGEIQDFLQFMDAHIKTKSGESTKKMLKVVKTNVIKAYKIKAGKFLDFDQIDINFFRKFQNHLLTYQFEKKVRGVIVKQNYKKNYISKQLKLLKQFVDAAIEEKYVQHFTAKSIKIEFEDVDSVFTDLKELSKFIKLDLEGTEAKVRDKYVLNCFLGFRISDLNKVEFYHFNSQTINGKEHLLYKGRQTKTDHKIEFIVHEEAKKILKKYKYSLPKMSDQTFNEVLKTVALKAGLTKLVQIRETRGKERIEKVVPKYLLMSSHAGRRSFCTNFYNAGVPIQSIMSISGHDTEKEFLKYISKDAAIDIALVAQQVNKILLPAA